MHQDGVDLSRLECCQLVPKVMNPLMQCRVLGPLRLDLTRRSRMFKVLGAVIAVLSIPMFFDPYFIPAYRIPVAVSLAVIVGALAVLEPDRVEIRERGLVLFELVIPWNRIISYRWEPREGQFDVLRVRFHAIWRLKRTVKVLVSPGDRAQVEDLLPAQFTEWPYRPESDIERA